MDKEGNLKLLLKSASLEETIALRNDNILPLLVDASAEEIDFNAGIGEDFVISVNGVEADGLDRISHVLPGDGSERVVESFEINEETLRREFTFTDGDKLDIDAVADQLFEARRTKGK